MKSRLTLDVKVNWLFYAIFQQKQQKVHQIRLDLTILHIDAIITTL